MELQSWYSSFLVRVWLQKQAGGDDKPSTWQGEVIHIQTGEKTIYQDKQRMLKYIQEKINNEESDVKTMTPSKLTPQLK